MKQPISGQIVIVYVSIQKRRKSEKLLSRGVGEVDPEPSRES